MDQHWTRFHALYNTWPPLQARLHLVRAQLAAMLSAAPPGQVRLLSLCAGDGRDVLGVMPSHPRRADADVWLIERSAELVARGEAARDRLGLSSSVRFVCADATLADTYGSLVPADIVILAGVFGNLPVASVQRLIGSLPALCKTGGAVIWTHKTHLPADEPVIALIGRLFQEADFREQTFARTEPPGFAVVTHTFHGESQPLPVGTVLFTFPTHRTEVSPQTVNVPKV